MKFKINFLITGLVLSYLPEFLSINEKLDYNAKIVLSMTILMIFLWLTETLPNSVTAFIPIIVSPFLFDIELKQILYKYSSPVVFLLLGGFILALGFEKSNLHQRIAIKAIILFGKTKKRLLLCCVFSTAFFSMWLSNTATCLLMLPIIKFLVDSSIEKGDDYFPKILILSIAYSSSIGGMITPIGTIPNAILISFLNESYNYKINFVDWVYFIFPLALLILICLYIYFSLLIKNNQKIQQKKIIKKYEMLGKLSLKEKVSGFIIGFTALLWIIKPYLNEILKINLTDPGIAITCSMLFFILPTNKNLNVILGYEWFRKIPWNILILFGGGLSMAFLIVESGLANKISESMIFLKDFKIILLIFLLTLFTSIITEFTSNTATTFLLLPIFAAFAIDLNINIIIIVLPIVLAASCAFMMPISTPPNAIVYSANKFHMKFMLKIGVVMNLISVVIITMYMKLFGQFTF